MEVLVWLGIAGYCWVNCMVRVYTSAIPLGSRTRFNGGKE